MNHKSTLMVYVWSPHTQKAETRWSSTWSPQWVTWEDPVSDTPHQTIQHERVSLGDAVHVCQNGLQPTSSWGLICRHKPGQQQWWHVIALEEASCCNLKSGLKVASLRHWDCMSTATWMSLGTNPVAVVRSLGLVAQDSILIAVPEKPPSQTSSASLTTDTTHSQKACFCPLHLRKLRHTAADNLHEKDLRNLIYHSHHQHPLLKSAKTEKALSRARCSAKFLLLEILVCGIIRYNSWQFGCWK